ncbi:hypothetical protein ACEWY4_023551 [Coilia grayii]|uniref:Acetylserotonin O-methyltransferase n=1 Tax=Coilia grayii TaxID=363190 RepID=A0ABD1J3C3_9TELE
MSVTKDDETYPRKILQYMEGFLISKTLFAACELGVFDHLETAERPLSAAEVAQGLGSSEDGTRRLLSACAGLELLTVQQCNNQELAVVEVVRWRHVTLRVKTIPRGVGSDEEMLKFMHLMNSIWNICSKDVVTAFDLTPFKIIYDLGGCSGALAKQCTVAYPGSTVTIFDLPKVVHMSRKYFVSSQDKRISFHEGDFFKDELPEANLYILARILHDWTDERSSELLDKVYRSCSPGGGVLLVEALLHEDGSGPLTAQLYSLNMLVQTEGRERKASEYACLLTAAGFTNIQVQRTGKIYDAILARK